MAATVVQDKMGERVVVYDVRKLSSLTDFCLIATGANPPHLKALAEAVEMELKKAGINCYRRSVVPESGWIVLDYVDVVMHFQLAEVRTRYAIEDLWNRAPTLK